MFNDGNYLGIHLFIEQYDQPEELFIPYFRTISLRIISTLRKKQPFQLRDGCPIN